MVKTMSTATVRLLYSVRNDKKFVVDIMNIIKASDIDYQKITVCLKSGGIIIYPTDTAYALGCDATQVLALKKIFKIKKRDQDKTLPLIISSLTAANEWADFSGQEKKIAEQYWPGPLTMILKARSSVLTKDVIKDGCLAMRVPDNKIAQDISFYLQAPLISTSANLAGSGTFYKIKDVLESLDSQIDLIDYIIDAGDLPEKGVSTIIKVDDSEIKIIREGVIIF